MAIDFSQLREKLSLEADSALFRQVWIFSGDNNWQNESLITLLQGYENQLLWLGENAPEIIPSVTCKKAHSFLGSEKQVVIFDANEAFDVDAFAAISGIVLGGGLFVLLMPEEEKWKGIYSSHFGKRLIKSIKSTPELIIIRQGDEEVNYSVKEIKNIERIEKKRQEKDGSLSILFMVWISQNFTKKPSSMVL